MTAGGFQRSSDGGPGWSYESADRYGLAFVGAGRAHVPAGWTVLQLDGRDVAFLKDGALATALKELLNRTHQLGLAARPPAAPGASLELLGSFLESAERDGAGYRLDVTAEALEEARALVLAGRRAPAADLVTEDGLVETAAEADLARREREHHEALDAQEEERGRQAAQDELPAGGVLPEDIPPRTPARPVRRFSLSAPQLKLLALAAATGRGEVDRGRPRFGRTFQVLVSLQLVEGSLGSFRLTDGGRHELLARGVRLGARAGSRS